MQPVGQADAQPATRRTSSPRPSRSPSTSATCVPGIDVTNDPLLQGRLLLLPRHPAHPAGRAELHRRSRSTGRTRRSTTCSATASTSTPCTPASAPYRPNSLDGGCPFLAGDAEDGVRRRAGARWPRRRKVRARPGVVRRPLQPGAAVLAEHDAGRAGAHRRAPTPSSSASATSRRSRSASCRAWPTSTRCCARRSPTGLGPAGAGADRASSPTPTPSPALSQVGGTWPADGRIDRHRRRPATATSTRVEAVRRAVFAAGMVPLRDRPARRHGRRRLPVQRTFATARSVEFDAVLLAGGAGAGAGRAAGPRRQGRRRRTRPSRRPARLLLRRGVLAARQGDRRLGAGAVRCSRPPGSPGPASWSARRPLRHWSRCRS